MEFDTEVQCYILLILGLPGSQRPLMSQPINPMIPSLSQGAMPQPHHKTSNFDKLIMKLQVALPKYNRYAPKFQPFIFR